MELGACEQQRRLPARTRRIERGTWCAGEGWVVDVCVCTVCVCYPDVVVFVAIVVDAPRRSSPGRGRRTASLPVRVLICNACAGTADGKARLARAWVDVWTLVTCEK